MSVNDKNRPQKRTTEIRKDDIAAAFNLLIPNIKGRVIFTNKNKNKSQFI